MNIRALIISLLFVTPTVFATSIAKANEGQEDIQAETEGQEPERARRIPGRKKQLPERERPFDPSQVSPPIEAVFPRGDIPVQTDGV